MKKINPLNIKAYEFNELNKEAKDKAIAEHIEFWLEVRTYDEDNRGNFEKAIDKSEQMQIPWFVGEYVYEYCKEEVEEEIISNEYLYTEKGDFIPLIYNMKNGKVEKIYYSPDNSLRIEVQIEDVQ